MTGSKFLIHGVGMSFSGSEFLIHLVGLSSEFWRSESSSHPLKKVIIPEHEKTLLTSVP